MPEPTGSSQRYIPGPDGLRALAVLAVVLYHLEFTRAQGGLLGVGVFVTLSGYLITDIPLARARRGEDTPTRTAEPSAAPGPGPETPRPGQPS
jgi:peptidoglycan/LPS O-acetylase OafA/YrhL